MLSVWRASPEVVVDQNTYLPLCGYVADRDVNAAWNILQAGHRLRGRWPLGWRANREAAGFSRAELSRPKFMRPLSGMVRRRAIEVARLQAGDRLLIPGVGTGLDLLIIPSDIDIIATDLSPDMLYRARAKAKNRNVTFAIMDAQSLGFSDACFDIVLLNLILSVVPDGAAAQYVYDKLAAAGYNVSFQPFTFAFFRELAPAVLEQVSPTPTSYATGAFTYSGSGNVTALVQAIDVQIPPGPLPTSSTSGCEAADFAGFTPGNIALIQRGICNFSVKAANAQAAGASAVIIFNEGQEGRTALIIGTLSSPVFSIPVVGASFATGQELYNLLQSGPVTAHVQTNTISEFRTTKNVIAETPKGRADDVIVVGAHLDSRIEGPGINDNGSGSGTILEIALQMSKLSIQPVNKVRFAFWGAEELNLLGSTHYVSNLSAAEIANIAMNLNFDMVGSPNFVRFVYDGDNSAFPVGPGAAAGPPGSAQIEREFADYFSSQGLASAPTPFSGRSDYGPFIAVNIPAGGLFTGAEGVKTAEEAAIFGGTAGVAYDPCYHQAYDTFAAQVPRLLAGDWWRSTRCRMRLPM